MNVPITASQGRISTPGNLRATACPSRKILKSLTSLWGLLVLQALLEKPMRFAHLRRSIEGVSEKMLVQALKVLERDGFVLRSPRKGATQVEYELTPIGVEAARKVMDLAEWIEANLNRILEARATGPTRDVRAQRYGTTSSG